MDLLKKFFVEDDGADLTEYAMLLAFIAFIAIVGVQLVGNSLLNWFNSLGTNISSWADGTV
jgi:Flp pilus assembly pilin Flp